mgnify:CR=1 FL=1
MNCAVYPLMDVYLANYVTFQRFFQCSANPPSKDDFTGEAKISFFSLDEILVASAAGSRRGSKLVEQKASSCAQ